MEPCRHLGSSGLPTPGWPWPRWCSFSGTSDGPVTDGDRTTHPQVPTVSSRCGAHADGGTRRWSRTWGAGEILLSPGPAEAADPGTPAGTRCASSCLFEIVEGCSTSPPLAMGRSTWSAPPEESDRARGIGHFSRKAPGSAGCMPPVRTHPSPREGGFDLVRTRASASPRLAVSVGLFTPCSQNGGHPRPRGLFNLRVGRTARASLSSRRGFTAS